LEGPFRRLRWRRDEILKFSTSDVAERDIANGYNHEQRGGKNLVVNYNDILDCALQTINNIKRKKNIRQDEDYCLLGCEAVYSGSSLLTFRRTLLPTSLEQRRNFSTLKTERQSSSETSVAINKKASLPKRQQSS
jgi:hypothetical protein